MTGLLAEKLREVLRAVLPLIATVCVLQFTLVHAPLALFLQFLVGSAFAIVGMLLLFVGIDHGVLQMGRYTGAELPKKGSLTLIAAVGFGVAFATTVAEPDVLVLARQAGEVTKGALSSTAVLYVIGLGLAAFAAIAMVRVVVGWSMRVLLTVAYVGALALGLAAPPEFVSLAFDAGSVTTGVLSSPVIIALTVGLASVLAGRSPARDGFGILGFASMGAIIAVLVMGMLRA